jgi:hypothetical protein
VVVDRELGGSLHANKTPVGVWVQLDACHFEGAVRRPLRRLRRETSCENKEYNQ